MSPEILQNKPYNHKSDIWALGCILYELATLNHVFDAKTLYGLASKITKGRYLPVNGRYSKELRSFVRVREYYFTFLLFTLYFYYAGTNAGSSKNLPLSLSLLYPGSTFKESKSETKQCGDHATSIYEGVYFYSCCRCA